MGLSWMVGRSEWTSASPSAHTLPPLACIWVDLRMPETDSEEIVEGEAGEMAEDEAEVVEAGGTSEGVTSGVDLPATMMTVARPSVTTMTVGLPPVGTMMTAMLLLWTDMLTATALRHLVTMMIEAHPHGITMIAMAAVAAAEVEVAITRRDRMTEEALWTAMLAVVLKGTTVLGTPTGMIGTVARAMGQGGLGPQAHSTGMPGHGGITEAEAGAMRGRQDLHCLQDRLWLQDTERRMHPSRIKMNHIRGFILIHTSVLADYQDM